MDSFPFFNAHHSPIGAFASLTLGCKGSKGGLGAELRGPADDSFYVGVEEARRPGMYQCLPFLDGGDWTNSVEDFDVEGLSDHHRPRSVFPYGDEDIERIFGAATDTWRAGDLELNVYSPVRPIPDPETASPDELRIALVPAVILELTVDNRAGTASRKAFVGYNGSDPTRTLHPLKGKVTGVAQGVRTGIATLEAGAFSGVAFQAESVLDPKFPENLDFALGNCGVVVATVPAGEKRTIRFAAGFYNAGPATTGIDTDYYYQSLFDGLEDALNYALTNADAIVRPCRALDNNLEEALGNLRARTLGHAIRSYYGSTQLLRRRTGEPLWVVNEGEYRMMNTFDLTVDQLFMELALNPWTVRNVLELFVERYSYEDDVRLPDSDRTFPGGLAFCHDMGVANHFTEQGRSCYEQAGLTGVFSYMSCEELVNWALCACTYVSHTRDTRWLKRFQGVFGKVLTSLVNRDHPDPQQRTGVMGLDSDRCKKGAEITTYDSLDKSLGQARSNLYLAVKTWAAYVLMEEHFRTLGESYLADVAKSQARLCAQTVVRSADEHGYLPAVIGEGNHARIIPAIEGLVYPYMVGRPELVSPTGPYAELRACLERHFDLVTASGECRFSDGGWRLSSTSRNSWLSKIYLCQFVAEAIFGKRPDVQGDEAHWAWLMDEDNSYYAWSDQMLEGKADGSRYYPRGVTGVLWLSKEDAPLKSIANVLLGGALRQHMAI